MPDTGKREYFLPVDLSIIIVNWNGGDLLRRTVESVVACAPSVEYEIILVDNASSDDSVGLLNKSETAKALTSDRRLTVVLNQKNRGFGQANNQAFALTNAPFLFLLNPDAEVTPGSIDRLIATARSGSRVGAAGPRILNADGSLQISAWRNPPAAWEILLSQLKLYLILPRRFRGELLLGGHWDHARERDVPMLSGAAILVRREVIEQVGGFDERFHMYGEDNEWCLRIVRAGWQLVFQPQAVVLHHGGKSSLQRWTSLEKIRVQIEAHHFFQQQSLPHWRLLTNQIALYLTASGQYYVRRLRGAKAPELKLARDIHWQHVKHALFGVSHRTP